MRPPRRRPAIRSTTATLLVALTVSAGACSDGAPSGDATTSEADADERIATILELRTTLGPAAAELGTVTATLVGQLESLHAALPDETDARRTGVDSLVTGPVTDLGRSLAGFGPELAGDATGPDAEAVREALTDARTAGEALAAAVEEDLALVERVAGADEQLAALVAAWGEPGSRSEQLQRFAEVAGDAEALVAELAEVEDVPECSGRIARRVEAARAVADATEELRALVESRRGEEFDGRRDELEADPYGTGDDVSFPAADRAEVGCWRDDGPVAARAGEVAAALEALEAALNPSDLATAGD